MIREVLEETGTDLKIDRLGFLFEGFFTEEVFKKIYHEIGCYYYMKYDGKADLIGHKHSCTCGEESLEWVPISELSNMLVYPIFLKKELNNISKEVKHIIEKQDDNEVKVQCF